MAKLSPILKNHLEVAKPDDWVDVVLEVPETSPPARPITNHKEQFASGEQLFASSNKDVIQAIQDAGGQVLDKSWLSSAIKARIQVHGIDQLASLDRVQLIDLPRRLTRG